MFLIIQSKRLWENYRDDYITHFHFLRRLQRPSSCQEALVHMIHSINAPSAGPFFSAPALFSLHRPISMRSYVGAGQRWRLEFNTAKSIVVEH